MSKESLAKSGQILLQSDQSVSWSAKPHMAKTLTTSKEGKIQRLNCIKIALKIPEGSQLAFFLSSKQTNKSISSYCFALSCIEIQRLPWVFTFEIGETLRSFNIKWKSHSRFILNILASFKNESLPGRWRLGGQCGQGRATPPLPGPNGESVEMRRQVWEPGSRILSQTSFLDTHVPRHWPAHTWHVSHVMRYNLLCEARAGRKKLWGN